MVYLSGRRRILGEEIGGATSLNQNDTSWGSAFPQNVILKSHSDGTSIPDNSVKRRD